MKKGENNFLIKNKKIIILGAIGLVVIGVLAFFLVNNQENQQNIRDADLGKVKDEGGKNSGIEDSGIKDGGSGASSGETSDIGENEDISDEGIVPVTVIAGGNISSSSLTDTVFPYKTEIYRIARRSNNRTVNFTYQGRNYILEIWWADRLWNNREVSIYGFESRLKSGNNIIPKISHEYGEDEEGKLRIGYVNFFDINGDNRADLYVKHMYQEFMGSVYCGEGVLIRIDNKTTEICNDRIDNDGNGLTDCQEEECNYAYGLNITLSPGDGGYDFVGWCQYPHEEENFGGSCFDNFDNDGNGKTDGNDIDCHDRTCNVSNHYYRHIWSFMPEDTNFENPPIRKGCCLYKDCVNAAGECIAYDTYYETSAGNAYYICGNQSNWDRCGPVSGGAQVNKYPEDESDGGNCACKQIGSVYKWACA
jgi:hypothetical protein